MGKRIIRLVILAIVASIIIAISWYYGLFTPYNSFAAKRDIRNGNIRFISYGLALPSPRESVIDSINNKYGIDEYNIGCVVTTDEIRGISFYNRTVESYLKNRHGKKWLEQYNRIIDSVWRVGR